MKKILFAVFLIVVVISLHSQTFIAEFDKIIFADDGSCVIVNDGNILNLFDDVDGKLLQTIDLKILNDTINDVEAYIEYAGRYAFDTDDGVEIIITAEFKHPTDTEYYNNKEYIYYDYIFEYAVLDDDGTIFMHDNDCRGYYLEYFRNEPYLKVSYYDYVKLYKLNGKTLQTKSINSGKLNIYPNPSNNQIKINPENELKDVIIYSLDGKFVDHIILNNRQNTIDVSNYPNGGYVIKINGKSLRLIKNSKN